MEQQTSSRLLSWVFGWAKCSRRDATLPQLLSETVGAVAVSSRRGVPIFINTSSARQYLTRRLYKAAFALPAQRRGAYRVSPPPPSLPTYTTTRTHPPDDATDYAKLSLFTLQYQRYFSNYRRQVYTILSYELYYLCFILFVILYVLQFICEFSRKDSETPSYQSVNDEEGMTTMIIIRIVMIFNV